MRTMRTSKPDTGVALLAANLRAARGRRRMTQRQLGELAGVHYVTIAKIESGRRKRMVFPWTVERLAAALGCSSGSLLGGTSRRSVAKGTASEPRGRR